MNKLPVHKRVQILKLLCEGMSMRAVSRLVDCSINTVTKTLEEAGQFCLSYHDEKVRKVRSKRVQVDEIWSFCGAKQKNVAGMKQPNEDAGDVWTWTGIDPDTKLIVSWFVGDRDAQAAYAFLLDIAERLDDRIQLTSDGWTAYLGAVGAAFQGKVDYAQLVKIYGPAPQGPNTRYSPPECVGARKTPLIGRPNEDHISTSIVERHNLTMRMQMRRFTRLTNGFSRKLANHAYMVAIYTVWYNWIRTHKSLRVTPAMQAGLTDVLVSFEEIVALMDAAAPKPNRPKSYKKVAKEIS